MLEPELIYRHADQSGDCWIWLGTYSEDGYGKVWVGGKRWYAHRASYTIFRGPIPQGLTLDHLCRTRSCVNPEHLEPVTSIENTRRGMRATRTHCLNGHPFDRVYMRAGKQVQRKCSICSRAYQRAYKRVYRAKRRAA